MAVFLSPLTRLRTVLHIKQMPVILCGLLFLPHPTYANPIKSTHVQSPHVTSHQPTKTKTSQQYIDDAYIPPELRTAQPNTPTQATTPPSTTLVDYTLSNGLRVIIKPDHRAPIVTTHIYYQVGSSDEAVNETGLSHALEHMMFKGTKKVSGDDFSRINAKFGGQNNAFTTNDETAYYQVYPAQYLGLALELEADRMQHLVLKQEDFDKEIQVVMEERRQRTDDNPQALAYERFRLAAYPTSTLRYPVIGHMHHLEALTLHDLKQWYAKWYTPSNAILVIAGDVNISEVQQQVAYYFGAIPSRPKPTRVAVNEVDQFGERIMSFYLPIKVPMLYLAWNVPSLNTATPPQDAYALTLLAAVLDGGLSARLESRLVREKRLLTSISSGYNPFGRGAELFTINAVPEAGVSLRDARKAIMEELNKLKTDPISAEEIERVKTAYIAGQIYSQDTLLGQARTIGDLASSGLPPTLYDTLLDHLNNVTEAQIQQVAQKYFTVNNLTTAFLANNTPAKTGTTANEVTP